MAAKLQPPASSRDRAAPGRYEDVVQLLRQSGTYPDHPRAVDVLETHISTVFLTDRCVYKLKKPVHYDFVDFSTLEAREHACREELRLNRRLAGDVYLDVLPITEDSQGTLHLGKRGRESFIGPTDATTLPPDDKRLPSPFSVVDWVVKMRRLPIENTLDALLRDGRLSDRQIAQLADKLAEFYAAASPLVVQPSEYRRAIGAHVRANLQELLAPAHALPPAVVSRVHAAQLQFLTVAAPLLDARASDGHIVDGHGDLRPEHICFEQTPVIFDCLEFNPELRRLDVADELSFLAMECDRLGAGHVGERVIETYGRRCTDRPRPALLNFYKSYRACVRAKVAALRSVQVAPALGDAALDEARDYLRLADGYVSSFAQPLVLVVGGLMGSGKSTLASALAETFACQRLATDLVRLELFGPAGQRAGYDEGTYRPDNRERVYDELFARAEGLLADGLSVVLDGTFLAAALLHRAVELADRHAAQLLVVRCQCPDDVAKRRIAARAAAGGDPSEARPDLYDLQKAAVEPCPRGIPCIDVDTTEALASQLDVVVSQLQRTLLAALGKKGSELFY